MGTAAVAREERDRWPGGSSAGVDESVRGGDGEEKKAVVSVRS